MQRAAVDAFSAIAQTGLGPWLSVGIEDLQAVTKSSRAVRDVKLTLVAGALLLAVAVALTLTHSPPRVVRVGAGDANRLGATIGEVEGCQANEVLPAGVSAIRLAFVAYYGARVHVTVSSGSRIITEGRRGPEWTGTSVTVPVRPLATATSHVELCFYVGPNSEPIFFLGSPAPAREAGELRPGGPLSGKVGVEYLSAGRGSWAWQDTSRSATTSAARGSRGS